MDFSNVLNQDEGLSLTIRLKWFPMKLDEEYVARLPDEVQVGLCPYIGLGSINKPSKGLASVISMRIMTFVSYETAYYQQLWKLLHEYEFKLTFREHE